MKKDDLLVLAFAGGAAFLIAKAAGFDLSAITTPAKTFAQSIYRPFVPSVGQSIDQANPGAYITNANLIDGAVHDYYAGTVARTPTIQEIFDSVLQTTYGTKPKSIIRVDGAWW